MNEIKVNHVYDFTNSAEKLTVREKEVPNVKRIDWTKIKAAITRFLSHRLVRKNGIAAAIVLFVMLYGIGISTVTEHRVTKRLTAELSAQYSAEFEARMNTYISQQEAIDRAIGDGSMQAAIEREADAIARVIGKMKTKRMKRTELWNILMRVDSESPIYPDTVEEVVAVPGQWMFYEHGGNNPIREDDRNLAIEQLKMWHDGRYPADLTSDFVIGEWSENDYVLRNQWEKNSNTEYWRFPE